MDNRVGKMSSNGKVIYITDKHSVFGIKSEPMCHGKRCGFETICIKDEIVMAIKEQLKKKGVLVCGKQAKGKIEDLENLVL